MEPTVTVVVVDLGGEPPKEEEYYYPPALGTPPKRCVFALLLYVLIAVIILLGLLFGLVRIQDNWGPKTEPTSPPLPQCIGKEGTYRNAAVSTDADICSTIGKDILEKKKGSAVDAALASLVCMGVANIHSMGIGGGFFMTYYDKTKGRMYTLDSREVAPLAATPDMYVKDKAASSLGGKAIAVPGEIAGYWEAHKLYGKVPWEELFKPSIKLCKEGIPINYGLDYAMKYSESVLREHKLLSERFFDPKTGKLYKMGHKIVDTKLAETLQVIADEGATAFYNGSLAQKIVDDIKDAGGIITLDDLKQYKPKWRTPVESSLNKKYRVYSLPPPSSGAILMYILNVLGGYNFTQADMKTKPVKTYQRIIETFKFAYARRAELGDQDFVDVKELLANLTSLPYADSTRNLITDNKTHNYTYYGDAVSKIETTGTSHLSVVTANGDAVSVTSTINLFFGSKVVGNRTGIFFNNEMDDFSTPNTSNSFGFPASKMNFIKPGKRPMSSMSPSIILDGNGDVRLVIGASGGSKIISSVAFSSLLALLFGESLKDAIDAPRLHHQWLPDEVVYEKDPPFPQSILKGLKDLGHMIKELPGPGAIVQAVSREGSELHAYADKRKGGCTAGY
ncbi:glutathione hydrolase 1 proenzyme-like [Lineus longissimus]|uniref:glutathione hydrolase 1 proenzyme-like n=1 Tax=Lineus longissimus TaxID=88925 RepID=UPI002B4CAD8A